VKKLLPVVSVIALALVIAPSCLYLADVIDKPMMKLLMLAGTVLWFVSAPLWLGRDRA